MARVDFTVRCARDRAARCGGDRGRAPPRCSPRPVATSCSTTATRAPGEKFADADLIGIPLRVTAGKKSLEDGRVDLRDRVTGEERRVTPEELV